MKCIVTGGAGFIGSHIAERLAAGGNDVIAIDNLESGSLENIKKIKNRVQFAKADISNIGVISPLFAGADCVFHHAALASVPESIKNPKLCEKANVIGTKNVLEAARKNDVSRVVLASSAAVYGDTSIFPTGESAPLLSKSPYAASKVQNEKDARHYFENWGIKTVSLRYFNVYGPRQNPSSQYSGVISKFSSLMKSGVAPTIYGDGRQTRDFIYVSDVVDANILASEAKSGFGKAYNIATGKETSVISICSAIAKISKNECKVNFEPAREGDIVRSCADISLAKKQFGFEPKVKLDAGLKKCLANLEGYSKPRK